MQATPRALVFALLLLVLASGAAAASTFQFSAPAQAGPALDASGASWVLVMTDPGMESSFSLQNSSELVRQEHEWISIGEHRSPPSSNQGTSYEIDGADRTALPSALQLVAQPAGPKSFYVEGAGVQMVLDATTATLESPSDECLDQFVLKDDLYDRATRSAQLCPNAWPAVVARPVAGSSLRYRLVGEGVNRVQWHNMQTQCPDDGDCPPGGARENETIWLSSTDYVRTRRNVFEDANGPPSATVTGWGEAKLIVFGGTRFDLGVNGWVRLPLASGDAGCPSCLAPANQTFSATGNITLANLQVAPGGGLQGDLSGDLASARFDEATVDPAAILGDVTLVAAAAAGGAILLIKFLLWPLFTRNRDDDLLTNDRRRQIYEFVVKHPGLHFREVLRGTGIPAGSGRYHVNRLVAAGLLTQRRQRSSLLLFENHKRFHNTWQDWAALRDPKLRQLHDWLTLHPDSKQKDLLDSFRILNGWSPTTTQRRLEHLVRDGVATARTSGRAKFYSATKASVDLMGSGTPAKVPVSA